MTGGRVTTCSMFVSGALCGLPMVTIRGGLFCSRCDTAKCRGCEGTAGQPEISRPHAKHCREGADQ